MKKTTVGIYLFPKMTMMDAYAPLQFFAFVEQFDVFTFGKSNDAMMSDSGALMTPNYGFDDCPEIDVLVVPGGGNTLAQMQDKTVIDFMKKAGATADYITSVCTGALILAEAGLLDGYEAATHWGYRDILDSYDAITQVDKRVAIDRNRITGGGITAGLDFALTVVAELVSEERAKALQLIFEYRPQPPFNSGSPETASPETLAKVTASIHALTEDLAEFTGTKRAN